MSLTFQAAIQNAYFNNPSSNISAPGSVEVISSIDLFASNRTTMLRLRLDF
jgi:hypothetical protein